MLFYIKKKASDDFFVGSLDVPWWVILGSNPLPLE